MKLWQQFKAWLYGPELPRFVCAICDTKYPAPHSDLCWDCYWRIMRIIEERRRRGTHDGHVQ